MNTGKNKGAKGERRKEKGERRDTVVTPCAPARSRLAVFDFMNSENLCDLCSEKTLLGF
jgi:hypothetical protein